MYQLQSHKSGTMGRFIVYFMYLIKTYLQHDMLFYVMSIK